MTSYAAENQPDLVFTLSAAQKVWSLIEQEDNANLCLRVYVTGGGCSGLQYGFTFEETIQADDVVIQRDIQEDSTKDSIIVKLLVDPISFQYLQNATIDYREDINGSQFVIKNPNAKTTCGCGSSFSPSE